MRTDPGFPADLSQPTRPAWRLVFDAPGLLTRRVNVQRVGQREANVIVDAEGLDATYRAAVRAATETHPNARLQLSYPSGYAVEFALAEAHMFLSISDAAFLGMLRVGDTLQIDDEDIGVAELRPGQGIRLTRPLNGTALAEHEAGTPVTRWVTQFSGAVTAPVYSQGRTTIGLRVVPVAFYPTERVGVPRFNHLPQPDANVVGEDGSVRVPNPRAPHPSQDPRVPRPVA